MEKLVYLFWAERGSDPDPLCRELVERRAPELLALAPRALSMNVLDAPAASIRAPVPWPADELPLVAQVSLWLDCLDARAPYEERLVGVATRSAGYLVTESLYTDYGGNRHAPPRNWPDGQRSPGPISVTLLEKPERLAYADWIAHWHGTQSPVSEQIQPRTRYVRNAVARGLSAGAPPYLGIVEEAWPSAEHVTDPMLFFGAEGSPEQLQRNIERMLESVNAFLDLERIRTVVMSEYLLRSWA